MSVLKDILQACVYATYMIGSLAGSLSVGQDARLMWLGDNIPETAPFCMGWVPSYSLANERILVSHVLNGYAR